MLGGRIEVSEFWTDLVSNNEPYLLGSFIFNFENFEEIGYVEIVDGQQRILAMMIFLAVIRDIMKDYDEDAAELQFKTMIFVSSNEMVLL